MSSLPAVIDIGLNLTHKSFQSDRASVVERVTAAGVGEMILTGTTVEGSSEAIELAREYPKNMFATVGVHPHHSSDFDEETLSALKTLSKASEAVAIGECGLDYFRNFSPQDSQQHCFRKQLGLAVELGLPVFLHERDAHPAFAGILSEFMTDLRGAVVHCFTGSRMALECYLEMGCSIGVTGWVCDERRGGELRELVPTIPVDRLMIETDAPYLLPRDLRPKPKQSRNEPSYLTHIGRVIADLRGVSYEDLALTTTENARRFFQLPARKGEMR